MIRGTVSVGMMVILLAGTSPAVGDVHIKPRPWSPKIHIEAERQSHPHRKPSTPSSPAIGSDTQLKYHCFPDRLEPGNRCALRGFAPRTDTTAKPDLTEGAILNAVREIGLPSLTVRIQPDTATLVNIPTIFYTQPQAFRRSVTLLGYDIDLIADPVRYRWSHGDGTTSTTSVPGKPYPSMEVSYRYRKPADTVNPRVDVVYRVRYRVDAGTWSTIGQTLLASGPTAALEVKEAAPVLTAP